MKRRMPLQSRIALDSFIDLLLVIVIAVLTGTGYGWHVGTVAGLTGFLWWRHQP